MVKLWIITYRLVLVWKFTEEKALIVSGNPYFGFSEQLKNYDCTIVSSMQLMLKNSCLRFELSCQLEDPPVVSEEQDLGTDCQLCEDLEADPGTVVVKAYENVVNDKWNRFSFTQMLFEGS